MTVAAPLAPVRSHGAWPNNAALIADCARLRHLTADGPTWDGTYREGTFWTRWQPQLLLATDLDPKYSRDRREGLDATASGWPDNYWAHVVLDPPYKLNGTDQGEGARYGVAGPYRSVEDRLALMQEMLTEGARVLAPGGTLLFKCQDQTNAGSKVWQTDLATTWATNLGLTKIDALQLEAYRPQPERSTCRWCGAKVMKRADGRWGTVSRAADADNFTCTADVTAMDRQHKPDPADNGQALSHTNYSTLLVFQKAA